jgi:hypothetical protein
MGHNQVFAVSIGRGLTLAIATYGIRSDSCARAVGMEIVFSPEMFA